MNPGRTLQLVLPHQLFNQHFAAVEGTTFVLIEHDLLFRQYRFHAHKLVLHRASMASFARRLCEHGYEVVVLSSDAGRSSREQLEEFVSTQQPQRVTLFDVVDDWLEKDLFAALADGGYTLRPDDVLETPNFLTDRAQIDEWFSHNASRMQDFYIWQRRRLGLLLTESGAPLGGKWSFDAENRKKLPRGYAPPTVGLFARHPVLQKEGTFDLDALMLLDDEPSRTDVGTDAAAAAARDVDEAIAWVAGEFPDAPGEPHLFSWATTGDDARRHLQEFAAERLLNFGPYEDAISTEHPFINHGLLTAALNIGLLDPRQVVQAALDASNEDTPLASLEGFVRQVIGWREYMRATYRTDGARMRTCNRLQHANQLGDGWWDATTGLMPVDMVVSRVLATGYAHHIERLMVLGNAMCLLRVHPDTVYEWFMELFIDAYDWVMVPNVYAMSQFAAGDKITTKPYVSGSNYLRKMSDLPPGEWTSEWDALYWTFIDDHSDVIRMNPRMQIIVSHLEGMDPQVRDEHRRRAEVLINGGSTSALVKTVES
jgi:deoxyribodipyrimidine photolyase-related protein